MSHSKANIILTKLKTANILFICLACFFTPLSTSLLGAFSILTVITWLLSGGFVDLPPVLKANPSTFVALLLFGFMAAAISYSPVDVVDCLETLRKYRELIMMPVISCLLCHSRKHRQLAENSFLAGCVMLMAISYLIYFDVLKEYRYGYSLVFHITHSFFMAVLGFWALHKSTVAGRFRYGWAVIFVAAVINLFYIAPGRTGMFIFCCLILLFLYQRLSITKWAISLIVFVALLIGAYQTSDNFSERIKEAYNEIIRYEPGQSRTSVGQRFDWWRISIQLIEDRPILGHGTGAYESAHKRKSRGKKIMPTDNPHNEYLFLTVQFGLVGISLFLLMIFLQLYEARTINKKERQLLQGVILALMAGSLMNSLLFDSQQGHFYLFMSGALLAGND